MKTKNGFIQFIWFRQGYKGINNIFSNQYGILKLLET